MLESMQFDEELVRSLRAAQRVVVMTGAGISAESGIPTFRDAQTGLWAKYEATELATAEAFLRQPKLVWDWYKWRHSLIAQAKPNAGHTALVAMAKHAPHFTLITQNIDGLHHDAGSTEIIELHGNINRTKCFDHGHVYHGWQDDTAQKPPLCTVCGSLMRPDVVWFGESLPKEALVAAQEAAASCEVYISVGTSSLVHPAASLVAFAVRNGAVVVEVNPQATPLTPYADFALADASGVVLPALVSAVWGKA